MLIMQAWLTPSKAARMLAPSPQQQELFSHETGSRYVLSAQGDCDGSQKTPLTSTLQQEDGLIRAQHMHPLSSISPGVIAQENIQPDVAGPRSNDSGGQCSIISNRVSPPSPLSAVIVSHGSIPGPQDSPAESPSSNHGVLHLSRVTASSQKDGHTLQLDDASSWRLGWAAHTSGSNSSNSNHSEFAKTLSLDPYLTRHLCLQELELLWNEDSNKVSRCTHTACHSRAPPSTHSKRSSCHIW